MFGLLLLVMLVAAGCGGGSDTPPTRIPTHTPPPPTPRSSPLPEVTNPSALGEGTRQIVVQFTLIDDTKNPDARGAANDLEQQFEDALDLDIQVEYADETTALNALCSGAPRAAWVSAFTYVKAQMKCGAEPVFAIQRGRAPRVTIGMTAEIIARTDITSLSQLRGQVFCRSDDQDYFTSWVFPSLLIASQNVNPVTGLEAVQDYPDNITMGRALYNGDCAAAALPPNEFEDLLIELSGELSTEEEPVSSSDLADVLHVLSPAGDVTLGSSTTSLQYAANVFPYEVLVVAPDSALPDELRDDITGVIADFFSDRADGTQRLNDLLDATGLVRVGANSYSVFRSLVTNANWDMTYSQ